jgi:hypothetical protein
MVKLAEVRAEIVDHMKDTLRGWGAHEDVQMSEDLEEVSMPGMRFAWSKSGRGS